MIAALEAVSKRLETGDYHKDGIAAEKSFVGKSKDLKEGVGEVKEKEWSKRPLVIGGGSLPWGDVGIASTRAKAWTS